jgi:hypothetical protein
MPHTLTTNPADLLNDTSELNVMLGNPPTWVMRFGVWAIFGGVLFLLVMA